MKRGIRRELTIWLLLALSAMAASMLSGKEEDCIPYSTVIAWCVDSIEEYLADSESESATRASIFVACVDDWREFIARHEGGE